MVTLVQADGRWDLEHDANWGDDTDLLLDDPDLLLALQPGERILIDNGLITCAVGIVELNDGPASLTADQFAYDAAARSLSISIAGGLADGSLPAIELVTGNGIAVIYEDGLSLPDCPGLIAVGDADAIVPEVNRWIREAASGGALV
mgnify:CR=1 FL=1